MGTDIKKIDTEVLWGLLSDITAILNLKKYVPDLNNPLYMFWYNEYTTITKELDYRMNIGFDGDPLPF